MPQLSVVSTINFITLVVNTVSNGQTTVNVVASPTASVQKLGSNPPLTVGTPGPQGPTGPAGSGGGGAGNLFIQQTAPVSPPAIYEWIQTGLGNSGHDMMFWVQDGLP